MSNDLRIEPKFRDLISPLSGLSPDSWVWGIAKYPDGRIGVATVSPHREAVGYFVVTVAWLPSGDEVFTHRGVKASSVVTLLEAIGFPIATATWESRPIPPPVPAVDVPAAAPVVYFIQGDPGTPIKIGFSYWPEVRLQQLQPGSAWPLRIVATMPGGFEKERELHARFAPFRLHGEWFLATEDLVYLIKMEGTPWRSLKN